MSIDSIKRMLLGKYGYQPTICYYYYLWNVVDYCGEKRVRESFASIKGQGDEIIVGDYCSTDDTAKIAREYGFKVVTVEKDDRFLFAESKVRNKVISEAKSNFVVGLNINVEYPANLTDFIKSFLKNSRINRDILFLRTKFEDINGNKNRYYGFSAVIYRPYLLYARGYNQITTYGAGSQKYGIMLMKNIYNLRVVPYTLGMYHKYHNHMKLPKVREIYPSVTYGQLRRKAKKVVGLLRIEMENNLNKGIKNVENDYW